MAKFTGAEASSATAISNHPKKFGPGCILLYVSWSYVKIKFFSPLSRYPALVCISSDQAICKSSILGTYIGSSGQVLQNYGNWKLHSRRSNNSSTTRSMRKYGPSNFILSKFPAVIIIDFDFAQRTRLPRRPQLSLLCWCSSTQEDLRRRKKRPSHVQTLLSKWRESRTPSSILRCDSQHPPKNRTESRRRSMFRFFFSFKWTEEKAAQKPEMGLLLQKRVPNISKY